MVSTLPDELVLRIVSYLNDGEYISFATTNQRFLLLLSSERKELNLFTGYTGNVSTTKSFLFGRPTVVKPLSFANIKRRFLHILFSVRNELFTGYAGNIAPSRTLLFGRPPATAITKLDVGNCYWLDPKSLTQLISGVSSSLTSLHVQGTKLSSVQVAAILKECNKIDELSVSLFRDDSSFWLRGSDTFTSANTLERFKTSVFHDIVAKLNQLTRLSPGNLISFPNFVVFLHGCTNLESLHVEIAFTFHLKRGISELSIFEYPDGYFPPKFDSLTKVTCRTHNGNNLYHLLSLRGLFHTMFSRRRNFCDVLWIMPQDCYVSLFHRDEATAVTIADDYWPLQIGRVLNYQRLNSLCIRPPDGEVSFLKEATTKLLHLKLISCSYDPEDF